MRAKTKHVQPTYEQFAPILRIPDRNKRIKALRALRRALNSSPTER